MWISPKGHNDPNDKWVNETNIYDGSTSTHGYENVLGGTWGHFIELTVHSLWCDKIRFWANISALPGHKIDIDVYYSSAWHNVFEGTLVRNEWVEKDLSSAAYVTKARVKFYNASGDTNSCVIKEFAFNTEAPLVTIQAPTSILPTTATANGNITAVGGANCTVRGFKYGLTKTDTWDAHHNGSYGVGAFTKALTGLIANTTYWIRAYATNSYAASYSEWIQFQTAAAGVIPTGTRLFICSDYSGYTYRLMRSETDDGENYTGYFVINTDLAEKKGLTIYKRILDLHLYFKRETSGTAEIYVRRDNEVNFQYLGSVSLIDVTEPTIIVKHLAIDVRGKSYDFKISYGNAGRFLGVVFEFIPEGDR